MRMSRACGLVNPERVDVGLGATRLGSEVDGHGGECRPVLLLITPTLEAGEAGR